MQMLVPHQKNSWSITNRKDVPDLRAGSAFISLTAGKVKIHAVLVSYSFPKHPLLATPGDGLLGWRDICSEFLFCS